MTDHDKERTIINSIRTGRRENFAELVRLYQDKVYGLCLSTLRDPHEAEEAAQEVFIKAFKALDRFREESSFSTWIYTIASRHCLDCLRSKKRHSALSFETLLETQGGEIQTLFSSSQEPTRRIEERQLVEALLKVIPPAYAEILILREIQGLSYDELAEALQCSLDAVKARLRRARKEIQEKTRHIFKGETV